jgi:(p)ppGpp synthase/HD superfamily hydrolase
MNKLINFVQKAHGKQKYGDMPYIVHLLLVERHFKDEKRKTVALLHDIVEDTDITIGQIRREFGEIIADAVWAISHIDEKEDYLNEYIPRCAKNYIALCVKLADLEENIYSAENNYPEYSHLLKRYKEAHSYLLRKQEKYMAMGHFVNGEWVL